MCNPPDAMLHSMLPAVQLLGVPALFLDLAIAREFASIRRSPVSFTVMIAGAVIGFSFLLGACLLIYDFRFAALLTLIVFAPPPIRLLIAPFCKLKGWSFRNLKTWVKPLSLILLLLPSLLFCYAALYAFFGRGTYCSDYF